MALARQLLCSTQCHRARGDAIAQPPVRCPFVEALPLSLFRRLTVNIILLVSDTFRFDNLFDRASMPVHTPELDRFVQRAVSLSRLCTASFPTIPHRTDLTSGRYGWPWYGWQDRRRSTANHLPQLLAEAGYVSQLICDCPHLFPAGFNVGFHGAHALRGQEGDTFFLRMNHPIEHAMPPEKTRHGRHFQGHNLVDLARWTNRHWYREADRFAPRTAALAMEWLEENYQFHPFFLWVDFFDPHEPWDPPEYMVRRYDVGYHGAPMLHPNYGKASDLTTDELRNLRAHYCAEAELVDRWVGRVLQKIDDLALWEESIVVFTTDHGMSLGEHNRTGKQNMNPGDDRCWPIYPEVARIPFLITAPGLNGGSVVDALLQPPDILPTLLELAGVEAAPPEPLHGQSFAPLLRGERQPPLHGCAISATFLRRDEDGRLSREETPALYTGRWAYVPIGANSESELYDLEEDPYAEVDIACEHPDLVRDLHARLVDWLRDMDAPEEAIAVFAQTDFD
jgi:arylsulfatase A-like enzyme